MSRCFRERVEIPICKIQPIIANCACGWFVAGIQGRTLILAFYQKGLYGFPALSVVVVVVCDNGPRVATIGQEGQSEHDCNIEH
jgi:hypothetical protein